MLQEENNENGVINQEHSQMNSQQEIGDPQGTPELQENRIQYPPIKSKRREANDQKKELANIFYDLITLVNQYAQAFDPHSSFSFLANDHSHLQLNSSNRLSNKKRTNKLAKIQPLQHQKIIDPEKTRPLIAKKQTLSNQKQFSSENLRKNMHYYESMTEKIPKEVGKRKAVYENYQMIMNYNIHESEDEPEASPTVNFHGNRIRNHEHSMSQYSFAYSSKNLQSKQRRKFSIQRSVQVKVSKLMRQMKISRQFQITQKEGISTIINYPLKEPAQKLEIQ